MHCYVVDVSRVVEIQRTVNLASNEFDHVYRKIFSLDLKGAEE